MTHAKMIIPAVVALLACTACEQPANQSADRTQQSQGDQATNEAAPVTAPADQTTTADATQTAGIPLSDVANPQETLVSKQVKDYKGEAIGEVESVALNADGTVQMVNVKAGSRTVAMNASDLTYAQNTIITQKSKTEIEQTAPAR